MCSNKTLLLASIALAALCLMQYGEALPSIGHYGKRFGKW